MGIEPSTGLITDFFIRNIFIYNNVLLNTPGISVWQGTYSAIQNGHFSNINIEHNTIIGRQSGNGAPVSFSYFTSMGQPGANVIFSNLKISRNIISANIDSLNNGRLISAPLNPQPALTSEYNLFNLHPVIGFNSSTDRIDSTLPVAADPFQLNMLIPHADSNAALVMTVPNDLPYTHDYLHRERFSGFTNAGAFELDTTAYLDSTITSITNRFSDNNLKMFPIPFADQLFIQSNDIDFTDATITLYDITGKNIPFRQNASRHTLIVFRDMLLFGNYILTIQTDKLLIRKKIQIQ